MKTLKSHEVEIERGEGAEEDGVRNRMVESYLRNKGKYDKLKKLQKRDETFTN